MLESWFQASLQVIFIMSFKLDISHGEWDDMDKALSISGLVISCVSVLYGLSTYNLRQILRTEPSIRNTLWFTLIELCTSTVIFLYLPAVWFVTMTWSIDYTVPVFTAYVVLPIICAYQLSFRMVRPTDGYFCQDYRINLCLKCQELDCLPDMVITRRRLVIVNMIYVIVTSSAVTIGLYSVDRNPLCIIPSLTYECEKADFYLMVVVLAWYIACILSFLKNGIELLLILIAKKCFLDWAFKAGLEKLAALARLRESKRLDELEEYNLWGRTRL